MCKKDNPGLTKARAAALSVGGMLAVPDFGPNRPDGAKDFNDLGQARGREAVRQCIEAAMPTTKVAAATDSQRSDDRALRVTVDVPRHSVASRWERWENLGLDWDGKGSPVANLDNAVRVLERDTALAGLVWFDEFRQRFLTRWNSDTVREWKDADDIALALYIQRSVGISQMAPTTASQAMVAVGRRHTRNEIRDWMDSIVWDGIERIDSFLVDAFGAPNTDYIRAASRNFWISMAARVYQPGCKVDTMPVLEGRQGAFKSTALRIIGGPYFAEASESPHSKDFFIGLQGKLLIEVAELDAFSRADTTAVKRVLSCQTDRYRAPYERVAQDHPRQCVFVGTTNRDNWHTDETGARRFWPIRCSEVALDYVRDQREQFFAEAVHAYKAGAKWWEMPEDATRKEQEIRRLDDSWESIIRDWLDGNKDTVTVPEILLDCLRIERGKIKRSDEMRVGAALRALGWKKIDGWLAGKNKAKYWVRPEGEK